MSLPMAVAAVAAEAVAVAGPHQVLPARRRCLRQAALPAHPRSAARVQVQCPPASLAVSDFVACPRVVAVVPTAAPPARVVGLDSPTGRAYLGQAFQQILPGRPKS